MELEIWLIYNIVLFLAIAKDIYDIYTHIYIHIVELPQVTDGRVNLPAMVGDLGFNPGQEDSLRRNGNPPASDLALDNPMHRGACGLRKWGQTVGHSLSN